MWIWGFFVVCNSIHIFDYTRFNIPIYLKMKFILSSKWPCSLSQYLHYVCYKPRINIKPPIKCTYFDLFVKPCYKSMVIERGCDLNIPIKLAFKLNSPKKSKSLKQARGEINRCFRFKHSVWYQLGCYWFS